MYISFFHQTDLKFVSNIISLDIKCRMPISHQMSLASILKASNWPQMSGLISLGKNNIGIKELEYIIGSVRLIATSDYLSNRSSNVRNTIERKHYLVG